MLASAIPISKNRDGNFFANSSDLVLFDRSASSTTKFGKRSPTRTRAWPNASQVALAGIAASEAPLIGGSQLGQRLCGLLRVRRHPMPGDLVFHEADSLSLHGMRHDERGLVLDRLCAIQTAGNLAHVVAINLQHVPVESAPLVDHRFDAHHLVHRTVDLSVVVVEDRGQRVDLVFRGAHPRFPDLPFLRLAISHHAVDVEKAPIHLSRYPHTLPPRHTSPPSA